MIVFLLACSSDTKTDPVSASYGMDHQVTTHQVDDTCFDGAMALLFMPNGEDSPQDFQYPVYIPSLEELPLTYEISLREPFVGMTLTATSAGDGAIAIGDGRMEEVSLGTTFGECKATMDVDGDIVPKGIGFDVTANVVISDLRGDESGCPVPLADPCQVVLYMESVPWEE